MHVFRMVRRSALIVGVILMYGVVGCGDSFEAPPDLVGTWNSTALVWDGFDYATEGMSLRYTLQDDGDYSYTATNDQLGWCDFGVANCTDSGKFETAGSQITFDEGTQWEETYSWSVTSGVLTISATFDGALATFTFQKQ